MPCITMYARLGYYLQMVAAFLLLALTHYFAAAFLPIADCDETFNFIEPVHYLLYGSGKQTWELCARYALRSWLFSWMYAWPAVFIRGAASLSSADVYFYLRIFNGRIAALAELFFVYSVWSAFSGKAAMVALVLLLVNYPIPHAAVSVLPTSLVMASNFVVLGCWLRTRDWTAGTWAKARVRTAAMVAPPHLRRSVGAAWFFCVFGCITGWPFAGLVSVPIGMDLLLRFPKHTLLYMAGAAAVVVTAGVTMDTRYYCRWTLSGWNVVRYNVFGDADRGPALFDVAPWFFFWKNLALNFHLLFVAVLLAPAIVLCSPRRATAVAPSGGATINTPSLSVLAPAARSSGDGATLQGEPPHRFVSGDDVRPLATHRPSSPTSPLTRARLHGGGGGTPERRSPLMSSRHPHLASATAAAGGTFANINTHTAAAVAAVAPTGSSRGRELLYMTPFFVWFGFWMCIPHKEERFMTPAYPFMVLAATRALCLVFFPEEEGSSSGVSTPITRARAVESDAATATSTTAAAATSQSDSRKQRDTLKSITWRRYAGFAFVFVFFLLSYMRAMAVYTYYSGPERIFYDWYPVLRAEAQRRWAEKAIAAQSAAEGDGRALLRGTTQQQTQELNAYFTLCLGREWYRFPSSFFVDHRYTRYHFLNTSTFHGMLPVSFVTTDAGQESGFLWSALHARDRTDAEESSRGSCTCGAAHVNDRNQEIAEQYVQDPVQHCDAVFDSLSPPTHVSVAEAYEERQQRYLTSVFTRSLLNTSVLRAVKTAAGDVYHDVDEAYAVMDVDRTPLWCRVLYYPFGLSKRCAVWRPLVLHARE